VSKFDAHAGTMPSIRNYQHFREVAASLGIAKPPTEVELARAREVAAKRIARRPTSVAKSPTIMAGARAAELRFGHMD